MEYEPRETRLADYVSAGACLSLSVSRGWAALFVSGLLMRACKRSWELVEVVLGCWYQRLDGMTLGQGLCPMGS